MQLFLSFSTTTTGTGELGESYTQLTVLIHLIELRELHTSLANKHDSPLARRRDLFVP